MKRSLISISIILTCLIGVKAEVTVYPAPVGEQLSADYTITADGKTVDVYKALGQSIYGGDYSFANFDFSGTVTIRITSSISLANLVIRPENYGIVPQVSGNTITITLNQWRYFSIEPNGRNAALLVFANPPEVAPPNLGDAGVVYRGRGIYREDITLSAGQTLYLAGGAIVEGRVNCAGDNIKVRGRGILSGNPWGHFGRSGFHIDFNSRRNISIEGITLRGSWRGAMWPTDNKFTTVKNVKVCNGRFMNEDAMSSYRSEDVTIEDCFFRSDDDAIPIKASSKRIIVKNTVLWCDRARAICIGEETNGGIGEDFHFSDIAIIHWNLPAIWFRTSNLLTHQKISFKNLSISEDGGMSDWSKDIAIQIATTRENYNTTYNEAGWINGVTFENIDIALPTARVIVSGFDATHKVSNVTFTNILRDGKALDATSVGVSINQFSENIKFNSLPVLKLPTLKSLKGPSHSKADLEIFTLKGTRIANLAQLNNKNIILDPGIYFLFNRMLNKTVTWKFTGKLSEINLITAVK